MPTILVTGAASGIGAAFIKAYHAQSHHQVIAVDRQAIEGPSGNNIRAFEVDVGSEASVLNFAKQIEGMPIDLVIHSVGIRGLVPDIEKDRPGDVAACETMEAMDLETMIRTYHVNAAGTFLLLRALMPNLIPTKGKVVIMSSRMGSIGNNRVPMRAAGSAYAYRAAKAAQNMIVRSFAADVPDVTFVMCHPGRVESKLVKWREEGAISAQESVESLLPLIAQWSSKDSGKFYDRFGEVIEW